VTFFRSKRGKIITAAAVVLALFLARPGANQLRTRIVRSISLALGRQVEVSSVNLRLLPQPGFDLENFVVHDDPAFSAEPMLQAPEVTAALRVSSLLRGRLEIARLSLSQPSLNLVRSSDGHWNVESLLQRNAQKEVAPTSKSRRETRPGFPYIEADQGRINFKLGAEKKPYALTNADFSLWQDSENAWGMRLKAQPVRTDFNLSDTGVLRAEGSWQRAASLRLTPLLFHVQWEGGQLGQITKLAYGEDKGWRGAVLVSAALKGTPADLTVQSSASVDGFRRYDLMDDDSLQLAGQCNANYSSVDRALHSLSCSLPVGDGAITLEGSAMGPMTSPSYDLALKAKDIGVEALVDLARHVKKNLPEDLSATGRLDAAFRLRRERSGAREETAWTGAGETRELRLESKLTRTTLVLGKVPFSASFGPGFHGQQYSYPGHAAGPQTLPMPAPELTVMPFKLPLGPSVQAQISSSGYRVQLRGEIVLSRLIQLAQTVGLPVPQPAVEGAAKVNLQVAGNWSAFAAPAMLGQLQLQSVRAQMHGLNEPLQIASASIGLLPDRVEVSNVAASIAGSTWRGSVTLPRHCVAPEDCLVRFDLRANKLATDDIGHAIRPQARKSEWYRIFSAPPEPGIPYLAMLRAAGRLRANRILIHNLAATDVSANVTLDHGKLQLSDLTGFLFGGRHSGEWKADFTVRPPQYSGSGSFQGIALGGLAQAMHDGWVTGVADARYRVTAAGWSASQMLSSLDTTMDVTAVDGMLPHITLAGSGPLTIRRFQGRVLLRDGKFEIEQAKLETPRSVYDVSGTASPGQVLNVKLTGSQMRGFNITGTLAVPHIAEASAPETRAALKP
jgi:AsmA family